MKTTAVSKPSTIVAALALLAGLAQPLRAATVFQDNFTNFTLGSQWIAYGTGAPDLATSLVGVGADGSSLRLGTASGTAGQILGLQTADSFPLAGARLVRVTARVRPLNQTPSGNGGSSDASVGVALIGASGAYTWASASANRPTAPTWADFYVDSEGSANASSVAYVQFPPNDPSGGAEAFRSFVLEVGTNGASLTTLSSTGQPLAVTPFNVFNPNLTLAAFSNSVNVALFQERPDATLPIPENAFGDVDSVLVEVEGDVVTLLDDPFSPPGSGPGVNWQPAAGGLPNVVSDRIALDATHLGLRMATDDTNGLVYGVQLVSPLQIPKGATGLNVDLLVQPRNGGAYDARLLMQDTGGSNSLTVSFNEFFPGGGTRRIVTLGAGGGGAFSQASTDYAFSPYTFYHALIAVEASGTTVTIKSEDLSSVIQTFVVPQLTISNLLGKSWEVSLLQADVAHTATYIGSPECFVDRLTVTVTSSTPPPLIISITPGGNIIEDSKPSGVAHNGVNIGAKWAASSADAGGVTRNGVMQFSASATNQVALPADPDFGATAGTILFWMRSAGTAGSGNGGGMLFDRMPTDTNGPPGAVLAQTDAGNVLFQASSGAGIAGFPSEVSDRINLDGTHLGYRMRTSDLSGAVYGIQLATPLTIAAGETNVALDFLVQNRGGGAYPARLVLNGFGGGKSLAVSLNEFPPDGHARQFVAFGNGGGGAFSQASSDYTQSPYNFYHVLVAIGVGGTTIDLMSEDLSTDLQEFSVPEFTVADLAGASAQVSILQAANTSSATEALVESLTVTSGIGGGLLSDNFQPPAAGPGANWVAASANGVASQFASAKTLNDNRWHQVALVYDQSASGVNALFIDGVADASQTNAAPWSWGAAQAIDLGRSHRAYWRGYDGQLDDFRIYNRALTASEIAQASGSGALVDTAALMVRFNFDGPPAGWTLTWPGASSLESTTNLTPPAAWSPVAGATSPYFIGPLAAPINFYRTSGH